VATVEPSEVRKTVTVLFCDLTGSTALGESLDPEPLRALLARYFERMKVIVERHGGTVEKFIGDAVMAVFGIPQSHEDDALRAVRAAAEMRDALPELGITGRIGVMTGEVVTGTEERLATGDAVNVAARLEQAAAPGEVLVGESTLALVRGAVEVETCEPLALKGKSEPVTAFRLIAVRDPPERAHDAALVGRERERETLLGAWRGVVGEPRCELVTVLGEAGVGKSRLVSELLASLDTRIARGRCLPYGEGVGYWPVVEVVKQLAVVPVQANAASAIRSLLGESNAPTSADEIAWAFRKTLEQAGTEGPLVVVFDDVQWGEAAFLDLIEHVALFSAGVPLLLVCMARPELLDARPGWPITLRLEPLPEEAVEQLIPQSIATELRARILHAAGGNPLFVHEMVAMVAETEGDVVVPPTLQALLAARLDQLERPERAVLERGAIEGEIFHRGAVQALADEEHVTPRLAALVRRQLIRPDRSQLPGDDGFRFRHLLIRDAAYDALPKSVRADLHAAFGRWLEKHGESLVELDEILAYHYDEACRYRNELGLPPDPEIVRAARERMRATGDRLSFRLNNDGAVRAYARALELAGDEVDVVVAFHLADGLFWGGQGDEAMERIRELAARADAATDRAALLCARLLELTMLTAREPEGATERLDALVAEAEPEFTEAGNEFGLYVVARARGQIASIRGRLDAMVEAYSDAAERARQVGFSVNVRGWQTSGRVHGTTPFPELLAWIESLDPDERRNRFVRFGYARALAATGQLAEAREALVALREEQVDQGLSTMRLAHTDLACMEVEELAGDLAVAAAVGESGCKALEEDGDLGVLSTYAAKLARILCELGRLDEAEAWAERGRELGAEDDAMTQVLWREAKALVAAKRGRTEEAVRLARHAVEMALETDMLHEQADAYSDLAEVTALVGDSAGAAEAYEQALSLYQQKGNIVSAKQAQARLDNLTFSAA
jgi:class 3 adenylate cyclase/tetratricopeptide (TPR) repeat protein